MMPLVFLDLFKGISVKNSTTFCFFLQNNPLPVTSLFLIFNDVLESQLLFSNPIVLPSVVSVLMNRETSTQRFGLDTGFVSTTNFDNLTNGTEYYGLVKMICLPASTLLLVTTTWMTVSFIIYGFKIRKKRHKEKTFLSGTSRWWTILLLFSVLPRLAATLSLAFVGYKKTPQASFLCELTMDISIAAYGLGVFPTYLNLWLRQRALYCQPLLQEIDTALVRYLSWGLFTCLTVGDVVAVVIYLLPRAYAGSRYGCINIEKSRYNIPHYVAIVMQITGQLSLLALFLYPLWVHKRVQETFRFSKRKHKITAVGVSSDVVLHTIMKSFRCTFACILSDLTAMITAAFIIPLALPRFLTNIVYDFNLTFNMIVTVLTFQNYRKVLKAVFGRCSK